MKDEHGFVSEIEARCDSRSDDAFVRPGPDWQPRLIVIDGCNIGRSSCGNRREAVSCAGLLSVVRWLLLRDFECVIFLPVVYNNPTNCNATHVQVLSKLEELGLVTFTPARTSNGSRRAFINYDDLYLTTLAHRHGGCVLSGDKFKDILAHPNYSEFRDVITNRVVDIRFLFLTHDVVHFGDDLFYRAAPELFLPEDISTRGHSISQKIFCPPDDPDISRVATRRAGFTPSRRKECLNICDDLIYELCEREGIRPLRMNSLPSFHPRNQCERTPTNPEDLQIAIDESVWSPGDAVTMEVHYLRPQFHSEEPLGEEETTLPADPEDMIDFSDEEQLIDIDHEVGTEEASEPSPPKSTGTLPIDRSYLLEPADPFLNWTEMLEAVVDEEENRLEGAILGQSGPAGDAVETAPRGEQQKQQLLDQLQAIFPRDIVECVLEMNGSSNLDYLAEQCLLQMS